MKRFAIVGAMALLACSGDGSPAPEAHPGSAGSGSSTVAGSAAGSGSAGSGSGSAAAPDARCSTPCRFLDDTPLDQVGAVVDKACGTGTWHAAATNDCGQLDFQRNCIYAVHGLAFKKKRWKDAFAQQPWYKLQAGFKASELTGVAASNVSALKSQAKTCRSADAIVGPDRKRIETWFAKLASGKAEIPAIGFDAGAKVSKPELLKALKAYKFPRKLPAKTPVTVGLASDDVIAAVPGKIKVIQVDLSKPGRDCDADDAPANGKGCQVESWLEFVYDEKGKLAAISIEGAACPIVYSLDGQPVRLGEILRNLSRPGLERTQDLEVGSPCGETVRFRIAEEKAEVTHLDQLMLVIGGAELLPSGYAVLNDNDGMSLELHHGEHIDVEFAIPRELRCSPAVLRANGYYERL